MRRLYSAQELHDRLIVELASIECAHTVVDTASESQDIDGPCLASAELVLARAIAELHEIAGDVLRLKGEASVAS